MDLREEGLLPAGVVERIDREEEKVYVSVTKDQIKDSPRFVSAAFDPGDPGYRGGVGSYYGDTRRGLP